MLRSEKGFTIIELLLVFLVAAILIHTSLYTYSQIGRRQLSRSAREIQTLIRIAQDRAYQEQSAHSIIFYNQTSRCVHVQDIYAIKEIKMPGTITMNKTNFPSGRLRFTGKLRPNRGGTIQLSSKSHQVRITVLPVTGRVKIYPVTRK